jgi:hypothetical protein
VHLGRPATWVRSRLTLGRLPEAFRVLVTEKVVGLGGAMLLAKVPELRVDAVVTQMRNLFGGFKRTLTNAEVGSRIRDLVRELDSAPFPIADATLGRGACSACPDRTGAQGSLFGDAAPSDDRCLDGACWDTKVDQIWENAQRDAKKRKLPVITGETADELEVAGWVRADAKAYALGEYNMVAPGQIEALRTKKREAAESDDEQDDDSSEVTPDTAAKHAEIQKSNREKAIERATATYNEVYTEEVTAKLAALEHVETTQLLGFMLAFVRAPKFIGMRRNILDGHEDHAVSQAQVCAWMETADDRDLALALLEDLIINGEVDEVDLGRLLPPAAQAAE